MGPTPQKYRSVQSSKLNDLVWFNDLYLSIHRVETSSVVLPRRSGN